MPPEIVIRLARPAEAAALTDLSMRSKQSNGYDEAFMAACRDELTVTPEIVAEGEFWVAASGQLLGCARLSGADGAGEVNTFFVDPAQKRRGIGRLLWAKLRERASALGFTALELDADPNAAPFYIALGFRVVSQTPSGSIAGRMLPRMRIDLGSLA
ncbi:MAG: GNAT family N-acetyltransferase [Paracoccaceae bacterium]